MDKRKMVMALINEEVRIAQIQHTKWNSAHEGYAVILEELDELWEEVKRKRGLRSDKMLAKEAIQVGATAARFLLDVVDDIVIEDIYDRRTVIEEPTD